MPGYARVPDFVREQIDRCGTDAFHVGRARSYSTVDLAAGALAHLNVQWDGAEVIHVPAVVPPPEVGRWSRYNVDGWVKVRRDLAKRPKTIGGWQVPNFGDPDKGTHTHWATLMAYPRETWFAQRLAIVVDAQQPIDGTATLGFRIDRVFDRRDLDERDLWMACSLLRENVGGHVSVLPADISMADWLQNQRVTWEILPRGEASFERVVQRLGADASSPRVREAGQRYAVVDALNPGAIVVGEGEFSRYFGFKFREDLVALECLDYGNALYLMYEDWPTLSRRTRLDLLADTQANYDRVVHNAGWEARLRALLTVHGHSVSG